MKDINMSENIDKIVAMLDSSTEHCIDVNYYSDTEISQHIGVSFNNGEEYDVVIIKRLTQMDAQYYYEQYCGLEDDYENSADDEEEEGPDELRDLSEEELIFLADVIAADRLDDVYWDYSGRGMYGRKTIGVTGSHFASRVDTHTDSMGLGVITYVG